MNVCHILGPSESPEASTGRSQVAAVVDEAAAAVGLKRCVLMYMYICVHTHTYIYIYI